ncbi:hypothetical protein C8Q80DRAFT_1272495 [Daedaleopsis nitida]|nr:hypothetical protein C8Q80DRAFT_1272495 [Daedaleopsis nitida]
MPAVEDSQPSKDVVLGHVNLMTDTFISNVALNDLQAIIRSTLATSPPSVTDRFKEAARARLVSSNATAIPDRSTLFDELIEGSTYRQRSPRLEAVLLRTRALYGAGMGLASVAILTAVVVGTAGIRWEADSDFENQLAAVDADIAQAIVSAGQELGAKQIKDDAQSQGTRKALLDALVACQDAVCAWGGNFPFERGLASTENWKLDQAFGG